MPAAPEPRLIDLHHVGRDRVIGCWQLGDVLVDPGPETCLDRLLSAIDCEPRALLLTHIHLDHAGASGVLVERFPALEVWVHERGAPHMADPARLLESAGRLYGGEMERLWGRVRPVPADNLRPLQGGETLDLGGASFDVTYTPGHAYHHVAYLERASRMAFVGDVAGVRIPPSDFIHPPTPPPDIDLEAWEHSIGLIAAMQPRRLGLTHFGAVEAPAEHLAGMARRLREQGGMASAVIGAEEESAGPAPDSAAVFCRAYEKAVRDRCDPDTAAVYLQAAPCGQSWLGLERYWRKRAAAPAS